MLMLRRLMQVVMVVRLGEVGVDPNPHQRRSADQGWGRRLAKEGECNGGANQRREELSAFARAILLMAGLTAPAAVMAQTATPPLMLEMKIPLGEVSGRIDHLGIDVKRRRLFVAELGNDSLGVVDLAGGKARTIGGFSEPQGVAYIPFADRVYVADGGDGSVRVLRGEDLAPIGRIELGDDADNVRVDAARRRVLVGYGKGALAVIDPAAGTKAGEIRLKGHPESFQIDETGTQVFVNVPEAHEVTVVDLAAMDSRSLPTPGLGSNFPMAIDPDSHRVLVAFRGPPTLMALSTRDGRIKAKVAACSDADDVFEDGARHRVYVSCGEGVVDVFAADAAGYRRLARVPTVSGARTSLFAPELDRLYVAVRATWNQQAAIWVFRPAP
jgi:DNA-binding beta-propeller fold protein YncE